MYDIEYSYLIRESLQTNARLLREILWFFIRFFDFFIRIYIRFYK